MRASLSHSDASEASSGLLSACLPRVSHPFWNLPAMLSPGLSLNICTEVARRTATHTTRSNLVVSNAVLGTAEGLLLCGGVCWRNSVYGCVDLPFFPGLGQVHVTAISCDILPRLIYS